MSEISAALQAGEKNIIVKIKKGTYFYSEGHLAFKEIHRPDVDIRIVGNNATLVPLGWELRNNDEIPCEVTGASCFVNIKNKQSILPWSDVMYADELVEVIDLTTKQCRLKCEALGGLYVPEENLAYIELTRWCRCYQYKVLKIDNGYIDFYAHDLEKDNVFGTKHYNVNYDYVVGEKPPRFRLCNVDENERVSVINRKVKLYKYIKSVYLGNASNFLTIDESQFRQFILNGITFLGNKPEGEALIKIRNSRPVNLEICNCFFIGQRGEIIKEEYGNNLYFHDNYVSDNYVWGIDINSSSSNTIVENNIFENNGLGLSYARCVSCSGDNYFIARNKFKNFGYCAISIGAWYGIKNRVPARGIVEYNEIWYDRKYYEEAWKHTIMDSGAIYVWTLNEQAIIRYNYIHDYIGMGQNRGIYLDDGAHHVAVYGNIVVNTPACHAIGSRRVARTERGKNIVSYSEKNNINNYIAYNITDGTVNFVGNEDKKNGCIMGRNILLSTDSGRIVTHKYRAEQKQIEVKALDIKIDSFAHDVNGIVLKEKEYEQVKTIPISDNVSQWIRVE